MSTNILNREFYTKPTLSVAKALLGKILVRQFDEGHLIRVVITEVEAYLGIKDKACHSYGGRRTPRNEIMWGEAGHAYIYFTYGLHYLLNVVTRSEGVPEAVLIRAGLRDNFMHVHPFVSGPARLTKFLQVDKSFNGEDLTTSRRLWLEDNRAFNATLPKIIKKPRVGIDYAEEFADKKWRLLLMLPINTGLQ